MKNTTRTSAKEFHSNQKSAALEEEWLKTVVRYSHEFRVQKSWWAYTLVKGSNRHKEIDYSSIEKRKIKERKSYTDKKKKKRALRIIVREWMKEFSLNFNLN